MTLTVTTCLMFCMMDVSPIQYETIERCIQQGNIIAGMQSAHLPRLNLPISHKIEIVCEGEGEKQVLRNF